MADVMENFFRGQEAGRRQQSHKIALEDSKLQQVILKHNIDRLKIEDQLRQREIAAQQAEFLEGRPAADIPSTDVTRTQPDLPATNLSQVLQQRSAGAAGTTMGGQEQAQAPQLEGGVGGPLPQVPPGTNDVTTRQANPITIPGVDFGNGQSVPSIQVRPRSLEELTQQKIYNERMQPFILGENQTRYVGGEKQAEGPGKPLVIPAGATAINEKTREVIGRGGRRTPVRGRPGDTLYDPDTFEARATVPGKSTADRTHDDLQAQRDFTNDYRQYSGYVAEENRKHADAIRAWTARNQLAATPDDLEEPPELNVQPFDEWRASQKAKGGKGGAAGGGGGTGAPKEGDVKPIPGHPGTEQTFQNGKWIRTK